MRLIIAGGRTTTRGQAFRGIDACPFAYSATEVVSGKNVTVLKRTGEKFGADYYGEIWAQMNGLPVAEFPADFDRFGPPAGPMRNRAMAEYAAPDGGLIAIWNGWSTGTKDMIRCAYLQRLQVFIYRVDREPPGLPS